MLAGVSSCRPTMRPPRCFMLGASPSSPWASTVTDARNASASPFLRATSAYRSHAPGSSAMPAGKRLPIASRNAATTMSLGSMAPASDASGKTTADASPVRTATASSPGLIDSTTSPKPRVPSMGDGRPASSTVNRAASASTASTSAGSSRAAASTSVLRARSNASTSATNRRPPCRSVTLTPQTSGNSA